MDEFKKTCEEEKLRRYYAAIRREGAEKLLAWLEENKFFDAPASTKYHGNYAGGLAEHSNHVFERLLELRRKGKEEQFTCEELETIAIVGLLHDICKIDAYKLDTKSQTEKEAGQQYTYTNAFPLGHSEKSLFLIMRHMQLTNEEAMAIRWHMGAFDNAVKGGSYDMNSAFNQCELAAALHIADMTATHIDERQ